MNSNSGSDTDSQTEDLNVSKDVAPEPLFNRKTRVGPWRNKDEFVMVFNWLFGEEANDSTRKTAYNRLLLWKGRRSTLTPATVLGTIVILEVKLKDDRSKVDKQFEHDMRLMYSSGLTRFFNYLSSIMQTKVGRATMYETARDLGIQSFLVDVRHLCAHGQVMPSLDILRRTLDYCMKWLKEFYWETEIKNITNVDARKIRRKERTAFDDNVSELFQVYDFATEALSLKCVEAKHARKVLTTINYGILKKFSNLHGETGLKEILALVVKELSAQVKREPGLKDLQQIYIQAFLKMNSFFSSVAYLVTQEDIGNTVKLHKNLFRTIAMHGFIEDLFYELLVICENSYEVAFRRKGAGFWANQIAIGFTAFKNLKAVGKADLEKDPNLNLDLSTVNSLAVAREVRLLYTKLGVDTNSTLIFGDTIRRPWFLSINRSYILERLANINEFTAEVAKNCLSLIDPPLEETKLKNLQQLINFFVGHQQEDNDQEDEQMVTEGEIGTNKSVKESNEVYTLLNDVLGVENDAEMAEVEAPHQEEQKFGVWSTVSDGHDWHTCPLGRLPWE